MSYPYEKSDSEWRAVLSPAQFRILREKDTERPYTSPFNQHDPSKEPSKTYNCAGCDAPLYKGTHKFKSDCGWPAFFDALPGAVTQRRESAVWDNRVEILCSNCGGHLGHIFKGEGYPTPTNERHCVNGISLNFGLAKQQEEQAAAQEASPIVSEVKAANGVANEAQASAGQAEKSSPIISKVKKSLGIGSTSPKSPSSESQASAGQSETSSPIVSKAKDSLGLSNGDASPTSAASEAQASAGQSEESSPVVTKAKESLGMSGDDASPTSATSEAQASAGQSEVSSPIVNKSPEDKQASTGEQQDRAAL